MKLLKKGIAKDKSYIALFFQCKNGVDTYTERFNVLKEYEIFTGYGCCIRTPDFYITIKGVKFACFWGGPTIGYDNKCYVVKE